MTTIRNRNPRLQGLVGLGAAISWFIQAGYMVSIPLNDSQPYDLIADDGQRLHRVEVKTTTHRRATGNFAVGISTNGGNRSRHTVKPFDTSASDLLFILTDDGDVYLMPSTAVAVRGSITLYGKYDRYRVVVGGGFEPPKAEPWRLQRHPFGHSGIPPGVGDGTDGAPADATSGEP